MAADAEIVCVTTDRVEGRSIRQTLGLVWGIAATIDFNNPRFQSETSDAARRVAYDDLMARAQSMGANAVLGIGMDSLVAARGDSPDDRFDLEYTIYGTAVILD